MRKSIPIEKICQYCETLWDINNGITLCKKCHGKTHHHEPDYYQLFTDIINEKNNILIKQYATSN